MSSISTCATERWQKMIREFTIGPIGQRSDAKYAHQKEDECRTAVYEHRVESQSLENDANQNAHIDDCELVAGKRKEVERLKRSRYVGDVQCD